MSEQVCRLVWRNLLLILATQTKHTHTCSTFNTCLCQTSPGFCGFSAAQKEPCLNKCQLVTRGFTEPAAVQPAENQACQSRHATAACPGVTSDDSGGPLHPPDPRPSFHNNGEGCGSPKHTNDQVLNIYSTCVLQLSWTQAKPRLFVNRFFYF